MGSTRPCDVIGDVHGHARKLESLLREMGYREKGDVWRHRRSLAVFVGDLIDRGPDQLETLEIVKAMVDAGAAEIVLGNHEFNAVAWLTWDVGRDDYCRTHDKKHREQHREFLTDLGEDSPRHRQWVDWFMTIPLWRDLDGLRVVHACWVAVAMGRLAELGLLGSGDTLTRDLVIAATISPDDERVGEVLTPYHCIEWLLKGPEVALGEGVGYLDKEDNPRYKARYRWWLGADARTLRDGALIPPGTKALDDSDFPELAPTAVEGVPAPYTDDVPVIFGHYWCNPEFMILGPTTLCVDFSAGKGGPLAAYRWDGEQMLDERKLVMA